MSEQEFSNEQQIVEHFSKLQQEYNTIAGTVAKLELEIRDHRYVHVRNEENVVCSSLGW